METLSTREPTAVVERMVRAINRRDLVAMSDCWHPDIRAELPAHPARNFRGVEQMLANWELIFGLVPNLQVELVRCSAEGDTAWAEWLWEGTQSDGQRFERAGVAIHGVRDGRIQWVRIYMQPILSRPVTAASVALNDLGGPSPGRRSPR